MRNPRCIVVAGTDTDAGKTLVTAGIARLARDRGLRPARPVRVLVVKPVQTGASPMPDRQVLAAPDLELCAALAPGIATRAVALFAEPCSPHLAARKEGRVLDAGAVAQAVRGIVRDTPADLVLLEGAGGLLTPLSETETFSDLFGLLGWPVLLVVANRLGAVNHALLSLETIRSRNLVCPGVILNQTDDAASRLDQTIRQDNPAIIARLGRVPCLASVGHIPGLAEKTARAGAWERFCAALEPVLEAVRAEGVSLPLPEREREDALLDYDRAHVWHPYTSTVSPLRTWEAVAAKGSRIRLRGGRELIDGMASWWCAIHGYGHPHLVEALEKQARTMPHVMFGGLTHEPAVRLAQRLLALAPRSLEHVFFADSGSVAVEVAVKMALQYQQATGNTGRTRLLTVRGGYHGDTFGAMSVCDPENGMHSLFTGMLPRQVFAPRPSCRYDAPYDPQSEKAFEKTLLEHTGTIAAVILEPLVQGAGGMWFYHPAYLRRVRELCSEHGCLLILDEIATGFGRTGRAGRTGTMFACGHAAVVPDIMCVGKGLTGGVMSLAATLASGEVARGISRGGGALMHGPTFMANALACAAANASLDILETGQWMDDAGRIEAALRAGLAPCREAGGVADVRVLGAIGVVEMSMPVNVEQLQTWFVEQRGVWIRPFGRLIYVMPPYVTTDNDLQTLTSAIRDAVREGVWR